MPATREAEVGESLEPGRRRLQGAEIRPLHSNLGKKVRPCLNKRGRKEGKEGVGGEGGKEGRKEGIYDFFHSIVLDILSIKKNLDWAHWLISLISVLW